MKPDEVAAFINSGPTIVQIVEPEIGVRQDAHPACSATAGEDRLVWFGPGEPAETNWVFVRKVTRLPEGFVLEVNDPARLQHLVVRRAQSDAERTEHQSLVDFVADLDSVERRTAEALESVQTKYDQPLTTSLRYARWLVYTRDGPQPAGIVWLDEPNEAMRGVQFSTYNAPADRWDNIHVGDQATIFEELSELAGRQTIVSAEMVAKGTSVADAIERALYDFVVEVYRSTGRSVA